MNMRYFILMIASLALTNHADDWKQVCNLETEVCGYVDSSGAEKIPLRLSSLTNARRFRNIIAALDDPTDSTKPQGYYMLKSGRILGVDSIYMFDATLDCEREGLIRFRDKGGDKVGFFDSTGATYIPAMYSDASQFVNGYSVVEPNSIRFGDGHECTSSKPCEHWGWRGRTDLINRSNQIVAKGISPYSSYDSYEDIDWYSILLDTNIQDSTYRSFNAEDGRKIFYRSIKASFKKWLMDTLLTPGGTSLMKNSIFKTVLISRNNYWQADKKCTPPHEYSSETWAVCSGDEFWRNNKRRLAKVLGYVKSKKYEVRLFVQDNPLHLNYESNPEYFDHCGEFLYKKHPYMEIDFSNKEGYTIYNLGFVRSKSGYQLIEVH